MRSALVAAARAQMTELAVYNAAYTAIAYPAGDVPSFYGVCTDVVIRAYRTIGIDLQTLVQVSAIGTGDRSIDHRRTDVLRRFFARHAQVMPLAAETAAPRFEAEASGEPPKFLPGDIVTYYRPQNRSSTSHMALVSDRVGPSGQPMIIHNRGWGVQEEDALFVDKMTGHYRMLALPQDLAHRMETVLRGAGLRHAPEAAPEASAQPADAALHAPIGSPRTAAPAPKTRPAARNSARHRAPTQSALPRRQQSGALVSTVTHRVQ